MIFKFFDMKNNKNEPVTCRWCKQKVATTCRIPEHLNQCSREPHLQTVINICKDQKFTYGKIFAIISKHFKQLILAECGDGQITYITVLDAWPFGEAGIDNYGVAYEWVTFVFFEGVWCVKEYCIEEPERIKKWQDFLERENLPPLQ